MGIMLSCLKPSLPVVEKVHVPKALGTWYVVGVIPTPFEKNAYNPTEIYTLKKEGVIDVDFTFNYGAFDGPKKAVPQTIYTGKYPESSGKWLASPAWPVKLDYSIMALGEAEGTEDLYPWIVVGHRSRSYFWVMSRETTLDDDIMAKALDLGKENGFDISKMEYPKHDLSPKVSEQ